MPMAKLSAIYLYPVKSLAGIKVNQWQVTEKGLQYDRKWMLVDQNHRFLSQRQLPEMALIKTTMTDDRLVLTAPAMEPLTVPLQSSGGDSLETVIWQDRCLAYSVSRIADQWFSTFFKKTMPAGLSSRSIDSCCRSPVCTSHRSDCFFRWFSFFTDFGKFLTLFESANEP